MKKIFGILMFLLYIVAILATHIFIINFLPYPYNHINVIFSVFILLFTISTHKKMIWLALFVSYFSEMFGSAPFGIGTFSLLTSLIAANWLQFNVFSNRSFYMIFFSAIIGMILYRVIFLILLAANNYFLNLDSLPYAQMTIDAGWEVLLSSTLSFVIYLMYLRFAGRSKFSSFKKASYYGKVF